MTVLIPDSIEPYRGYKALRIEDTYLHSPSQYAQWPKREPLTASCTRSNRQQFGWKLVEAPEGWEGHFWVSSEFLAEGTTTTFTWPPNEPEPGHTWIPEPLEHQLKGCQCGIYVVDSAEATRHYLNGPNRVLVEIALWGQVVIANKGARGQYAYPQRIFAAEQQQQEAIEVASEYDIPIEIVIFEGLKENE